MKCSRCEFDNPESVNFCGECGKKLEKICPECAFSNPPQFKFCGECGLALKEQKETDRELSFDEKIDKIQRYLPKGVTDKILSQRGKIEGERKQVTVMFCDLEGYTSLVESLGAEEAYNLMDQIYEILIHKVHEYEGTVNEMTGDGVMALFGAPIALEDAPQRAVRSAMAIHKELTKFSDKKVKDFVGKQSLKMRIGIHTGSVVVGTLGNNLRVDFKAVGDTVNLASRMEGLAQPGTTYVTEETYKLTEGFFRFEALGEKPIKGKKKNVNIYRVITSSNRRTRFDVSAERGLTPFVGRQRELELLIEGFERSKKGFGQAFSIVSEAGAGKSRLLYEFRKVVANEDVIILDGKSLSFNKNVAYHPVIEILKASFDILESDNDFEKINKIKKGLKILSVDEDTVLIFLLELLSVKDSGFNKTSMSPESKKDRTTEALKRIALKESEFKPLVLLFEDLHWIDKNSEEYLKIFLDSISGARIFLIFTYRPEFVPTWGGKSYHNQINLNRLSNREGLLIAHHLLGTDKIHINLEDLILGKTEGIPFFIEEFVKSLKDLGALEKKDGRFVLSGDFQKVSIPSTIQDVIAARVDTLPESSKAVLQVGSAIEREFNYQLVKRVTNLEDNELLPAISKIQDAELLFERGIFPDTIYIFKHALTRDVIYDSILTKRKKQLHEDIGNAFEALYGDRIEEYYGILAEHYLISKNYVKAAEYFRLAGKKAERVVSFLDAITCGEKWVDCLEMLPSTVDVEKQIIDARTTLGFYHAQLFRWQNTKKAIEPIVKLAKKHKYKKRLAQIYSLAGIHSHFINEDYQKAVKYLTKSIRIAEESNNFISLIFSNHFLGHVFVDNCEFEKGHHHIKKALEIVEMGNVFWSIALHKACIAYNVLGAQGKIDLAYQTGKEAVLLADKSGDILSKTEAYTNYGICCLFKGNIKEAEDCLVMGINFSRKAKIVTYEFFANFYLGEIYFLSQEFRKAQEYYANLMTLEKDWTAGQSYINLYKLVLSAAKMMNNEKDIDLRLLSSYVAQNKLKRFDGRMRRWLSIILLNIDDKHISEAQKSIEQAIEMDHETGCSFELGMDFKVYADVYKKTGNVTKAKEMIGRAIEVFKNCGADGWVRKTEQDLISIQ